MQLMMETIEHILEHNELTNTATSYLVHVWHLYCEFDDLMTYISGR